MSINLKQAAASVKIRAAQLKPAIADLANNQDEIFRQVKKALQDDINLLVLPELATSGYMLNTAELANCALEKTDNFFLELKGLLAETDMCVVFGFAEKEKEYFYNSAVILQGNSKPVFYRKIHLWDYEKTLFTPGKNSAPIVKTAFGNLGVCICYDLEFPEMPRGIALSGADILAVPTNWPLLPKPSGEHAPELVQAMAAARASNMPIVCCDRTGAERGVEWTGGTSIIDSQGWIIAQAQQQPQAQPQIAQATVTLNKDLAQLSTRNNIWLDRTPDLYHQDLRD